MDEVIQYWKREVDRLQLLLKAEQIDNNRLRAACAYYKSAAEGGYVATSLAKVHHDESDEGFGGLGDILDKIEDSIGEGDELLLPVAMTLPQTQQEAVA